jgi:hypothetical protein
MRQLPIESVGIWKRAFDARPDGHDEERARLRTCLLRFRERVGHLVSFIPADMKHYTVHDLSHLDALWETADLIAGESFVLNPAEAFVFGGAVLLHDAGMSVAAYKSGLQEIEAMPEWADAFAAALRQLTENSNDRREASYHETAEVLAITDTLRMLHARKAEELALQAWSYPNSSSEQHYLCEDSDLRSHYGSLIGRIAHSHHWGVKAVESTFSSNLGAFGGMPTDWSVDALKLAILLRCADAAHIDHRRAPRVLLALSRPSGLSFHH